MLTESVAQNTLLSVCVCVRHALPPLGLLRNVFEVNHNEAFYLAWRGSPNWSWLDRAENRPKNTFWPVNLPLALCLCVCVGAHECVCVCVCMKPDSTASGSFCYLTSCILVVAELWSPVVPIDVHRKKKNVFPLPHSSCLLSDCCHTDTHTFTLSGFL